MARSRLRKKLDRLARRYETMNERLLDIEDSIEIQDSQLATQSRDFRGMIAKLLGDLTPHSGPSLAVAPAEDADRPISGLEDEHVLDWSSFPGDERVFED